MDKYFNGLIELFGEPTYQQEIEPYSVQKYKGKLPSKLLEYWENYGWCAFHNGLFWIVNPSEYDQEIETWIGDTPIVEQDTYHVIARNGFGDMYLWGTNTGYMYQINLCNGWVLVKDGNERAIEQGKSDFALQTFISSWAPFTVDLDDLETGELLFDNAVKKYGPLNSDEIFGFEPALFAGGSQTIDTLAKVNIHVHSSILFQFGHREILDSDALAQKAYSG